MSFDLKILKGDIVIDKTSSISTVSGNEKLRQDIIKILLTKLGENKFHPSYGSKIGLIEIGYVPDAELLDLDLKLAAEESIVKLMLLQRQQEAFQFISPDEKILNINDISVTRDKIDPRMYNIFISVITQKLSTISDSIVLRVL